MRNHEKRKVTILLSHIMQKILVSISSIDFLSILLQNMLQTSPVRKIKAFYETQTRSKKAQPGDRYI